VIILPKTKQKLIKMKSTAPSPRWIDGVGEVPVNGEFEVPESQAKELENGQFKRVKGGETK